VAGAVALCAGALLAGGAGDRGGGARGAAVRGGDQRSQLIGWRPSTRGLLEVLPAASF
jgi:hypothetical protein